MQTANRIQEAPPPSEPPKGTLIAKLAEVMALVKHVPKNGTNAAQGYKYATDADILDAVRDRLAERGVMLIPNVQKTEWRAIKGKNGDIPVVTLTVQFTITDGFEAIGFTVVGEGMDSGDKATYKAMTGANKYAVLKLFLIPTGDDPEKDDRKEEKKPSGGMQAAKALVAAVDSARNAPPAPEPTKQATATVERKRTQPSWAYAMPGPKDRSKKGGEKTGLDMGDPRITVEDLEYWLPRLRQDEETQTNEKFKESARKKRIAMEEELAFREGVELNPEPAETEDIPF